MKVGRAEASSPSHSHPASVHSLGAGRAAENFTVRWVPTLATATPSAEGTAHVAQKYRARRLWHRPLLQILRGITRKYRENSCLSESRIEATFSEQ
jgi:hypothetical protein